MTSPSNETTNRPGMLWIWGFLILSGLRIWLDRSKPESTAAAVVFYASLAYFLVWFGSRAWIGYRRRKPYWTRESWHRYLRLTAMPVFALILLFSELYFFDNGGSRTIFGEARSSLRTVWVLIDLALMAIGAVGGTLAIEWLARGEPSQQFTRTGWLRRGDSSAIPN
jgi:hypothetical protein